MHVRSALSFGTALAACQAGAGDPDSGSTDRTAPRVVASSPLHGAPGVYPARVFGGTAPRVRISVRFDEPIDPDAALVAWSAVGGAPGYATPAWSPDATELSVELVGSSLTGQPPLADLTTYQLDLGDLRDAAGNRVAPDDGLTAGMLRFTTGVYDPLLNHACGHVVVGPYADAVAAPSPSPLAPRTDVAHTRYTVALPDAASGRAGYTRIRAPAAATWHLFVDGDAPLALEDDAGAARPLASAVMPDACDGISRRLTFEVAALDQRFLRFGPQREPVTRLIVETVAGGN